MVLKLLLTRNNCISRLNWHRIVLRLNRVLRMDILLRELTIKGLRLLMHHNWRRSRSTCLVNHLDLDRRWLWVVQTAMCANLM